MGLCYPGTRYTWCTGTKRFSCISSEKSRYIFFIYIGIGTRTYSHSQDDFELVLDAAWVGGARDKYSGINRQKARHCTTHSTQFALLLSREVCSQAR